MDPPHTLSLDTQSTVNRGTYIFRQGHDIDLSSIIKIISICDLIISWIINEFADFGGQSLDGANKIGMYDRCYKRAVFHEWDGW